MSFGVTLGFGLLAGLAFWGVSLRLRDASVVDIFWGYGFAGIAAIGFWLGEGGARALVVSALALLWSLRLGTYLLWRSIGEPEDPRYAEMRAYHGERFASRSLISVFGFQALIQWVVSMPIQVAQRSAAELGPLDALGLALFVTGFAWEAVADWQLARFKSDPRNAGRVMDRGLWRLSRHPNYFGDFLVWWGFGFLALAAPYGWLTLGSPALLTFFILRVSGVPLLERGLTRRRPEYAAYAERTNAFFPGPPREAA